MDTKGAKMAVPTWMKWVAFGAGAYLLLRKKEPAAGEIALAGGDPYRPQVSHGKAAGGSYAQAPGGGGGGSRISQKIGARYAAALKVTSNISQRELQDVLLTYQKPSSPIVDQLVLEIKNAIRDYAVRTGRTVASVETEVNQVAETLA